MEELIYLCVRIVCIGYLLYRVYGWKKRIGAICTLLYARPCVKKERKGTGGTESAAPDAEVMGNTRYVYLDEDLDAESPEVESVSPVLSSRDMEVLGEYLTHQDEFDHEKAMQAARVLFSIRQTSLMDVFLSNMDNSEIVEELINLYFDEDGNPKQLRKNGINRISNDWRKYV